MSKNHYVLPFKYSVKEFASVEPVIQDVCLSMNLEDLFEGQWPLIEILNGNGRGLL